MSLVKAKRKCVNCGKVYDWNPDIGKIVCPKCGSMMGETLIEDRRREEKEKLHN